MGIGWGTSQDFARRMKTLETKVTHQLKPTATGTLSWGSWDGTVESLKLDWKPSLSEKGARALKKTLGLTADTGTPRQWLDARVSEIAEQGRL